MKAGRCLGWILGAALAAAPLQAYYHYVHYSSRTGNFTPIPAAFDRASLPNNTLTFQVSDSGPSTLGSNDSFGAVLSQIKAAAAVWDSVPTSDLRVAFGGLNNQIITTNLRGGNVIFSELPPGLLALGTPMIPANPVVTNGPNGPFIPVTAGLIVLTNNTATASGPSYREGFFTTVVHEMGHVLGLQHTWTGAAMSQAVVRNTSRARPLDADDVAGMSLLYGKQGWAANYGSISGRVTMAGQGVSMASVVAIPSVGPAVSTLTNPDGSYTIAGLPADNYLVYVHPLPPDAVPANGMGIGIASDLAGMGFTPTAQAFQTVFHPGTLDPAAATSFAVTGGKASTGVDFAVQARSASAVYELVVQSYLSPANGTYTFATPSVAVSPAYVDITNSEEYRCGQSLCRGLLTLVAYANSGAVVPVPRAVKMLGGEFENAIRQRQGDDDLAIWFPIPSKAPLTGPRHLFFDFGDDIYVLPAGVNLVRKSPPQLLTAAANANGTVTVTGTGMGPDTRVFLDGIQADPAGPFSSSDGTLTVKPPAGASGQKATVVAYNSDGQNSQFWRPETPLTYSYPTTAAPQIAAVSPAALPAGIGGIGLSAMVEITGQSSSFVDGQVTVAFGTPYISVRNLWVLSPTRLIANVTVSTGTPAGFYEVSVVSGFQTLTLPAGFRVLPPSATAPLLLLPVLDGSQEPLRAGSRAVLYGRGLAQSASAVRLTLNDAEVILDYVSDSQINFRVPQAITPGPATLRLNNGATNAYALALPVEGARPVIQTLLNAAEEVVDAGRPVNAGDGLTAVVGGMGAEAAASLTRVQVTVSGVPMAIQQITPAADNTYRVQFTMVQSFAGSAVPLVVSADGWRSSALTIVVK